MKPLKYPLFLLVVAFSLATITYGQEEPDEDAPPQQWQRPANPPRDFRNNVLRQLGLSTEQVEQIRKINIERRPQMEAAQTTLREANRALDAAIYADVVNDADVQARLLQAQAAQAEVAKIRFMNELAVRRILTPEQLVRFRELRQRFEEERQEFRRRRGQENRPFRPRQNNRMKNPPADQPPAMRPNRQQPDL
jgi:Spy/CpxP family protein refolding chaperone